MDKASEYEKLVAKRKECQLCTGKSPLRGFGASLANGADIAAEIAKKDHCVCAETENLGPWFEWAGVNGIEALNAKIVVLGQDWFPKDGYVNELKNYSVKSGKYNRREIGSSVTNNNIVRLIQDFFVKEIGVKGIDLKQKTEKNHNLFFFTNLVLCYKYVAGVSVKTLANTAISDEHYAKCRKYFFNALLDVIRPKAIIALGINVFASLARDRRFDMASDNYPVFEKLNDIVDTNHNGSCEYYYRINDGNKARILPVVHTGSNMGNNRKSGLPELSCLSGIEQVEKDWQKIGEITKDILGK